MRFRELPATIYTTMCPNCRNSIEYPVFISDESSCSIYQNINTGILCMLDLKEKESKEITIEEYLDLASKHLGEERGSKWIEIPKKIKCKSCNVVLSGISEKFSVMGGETNIKALTTQM